MTYARGLLNKRIKVAKRIAQQMGDFGMASGGQQYEWLNPEGDHAYWGGETWNKGTKALREGAVDAYDVVIFRFDWHAGIDRWCLLQYEGRWYQILSLNGSYQTNEMQITAQEMSIQDVTIVEPTPNDNDNDNSNN